MIRPSARAVKSDRCAAALIIGRGNERANERLGCAARTGRARAASGGNRVRTAQPTGVGLVGADTSPGVASARVPW